MSEVFLVVVLFGTLATIAGIVGLGLGSGEHKRVHAEERLMSSHRRRILLGILYQRQIASR